MDILAAVKDVPVGALIGLFTLVPVVTGLLLFSLRTRFFRKGFVNITAWTLTGAAVILFAKGALTRGTFEFTPAPVAGVSWDAILMAADFALLAGFVWIGVARRSLLIGILALAQLVPMAWLELGGKPAPPVEPAMYVDWLTITMIMIVSVVGSFIAVYALPYMKEHEAHLNISESDSRRPRFFLLIMLFLSAMNGLALANNLLWLYFFWEVTTLCSFLLIGHDRTVEALRNADRALWMNLLGGAGFVAALALLHAGGQTLSIRDILAHSPQSHAVLLLPMAFLCFAGLTKAAQMPFQTWLLGAMVAPTPVSALLHSSTMVKAGVYLIVRFAPAFHDTRLSNVVALAGGFTFLTGALLAIGQTNAKRVLAYSTISNLGLIIACAGLNTPMALTAAVMLIVFHAISKALLFMATGVVEHGIQSRDIEDMQGLVTRMPLTTFLMVIGILSMLLPPFGVLIAKLAAIESSAHMPPVLVLLVIGSTLTVVFWTKWTGRLLSADPTTIHPKIEHLHNMYFGPLVLLTLGAVGFSLFVVPLMVRLVEPAVRNYYAVVHLEQPMAANLWKVPWVTIFGLLVIAVVVPLAVYRRHKEKATPAYMCGEQVDIGPAMGFRTVAEQVSELAIRGFYFERFVGEQRHVRWITAVAVALVLLLFGAVYVKP
jgi:ech hydrogenase subunit A